MKWARTSVVLLGAGLAAATVLHAAAQRGSTAPPGTVSSTGVEPATAGSVNATASSSAGTRSHSPVLVQYRQIGVAPSRASRRAAWSPVRMLMSCSGLGPPNTTAIEVTATR